MKVKMRCPFRGATRFLGIIFLIIVTIACMAMSEAAEIFGGAPAPVAATPKATDINVVDDDALTIDASDAADVHLADDEDF